MDLDQKLARDEAKVKACMRTEVQEVQPSDKCDRGNNRKQNIE